MVQEADMRRLALVVLTLFGSYTILATLRPIVAYDSWWYHLPFASRIWAIGSPESFVLEPLSENRWLGFPRLWFAVQGAFWWSTGSLRAVVIPSILIVFTLFWIQKKYLSIPYTWSVLAFVACPLLFLHYRSTYSDLPAGSLLAMGYLLTVSILFNDSKPSKLLVLGAIACFAIAANIKYQAYIAAVVLLASATGIALIWPKVARINRLSVVAIAVACAFLCSLSLAKNFATFGNPFYPVSVELGGRTLFAGPEDPNWTADFPAYQLTDSGNPRELEVPGFMRFALSATEIDWILRGVAPWYNLDAVTGLTPRWGAPARTGGWGSVFFLLNLLLLALQLWRVRNLDRPQKLLLTSTLLAILATAVAPRAHELRYWLFLPIVMAACNLRFIHQLRVPRAASLGLCVLAAYSVVLCVTSPISDMIKPRRAPPATFNEPRPAEMADAIASKGRYCQDDNFLFRYSEAISGQSGILSRDTTLCTK
ncbi:hypothetical protein [Alsobacter sp. R-9]